MSFVQLLNSFTHDIANLQSARKRWLFVTNAIGVTTCHSKVKIKKKYTRQQQKMAKRIPKKRNTKKLNKIKGA